MYNISAETAKLAEDKGFDLDVDKVWINKYKGQPSSKWRCVNSDYAEYIVVDAKYLAPTQSTLQAWLRNNCNTHIEIGVCWNDIDSPKCFYESYCEYFDKKNNAWSYLEFNRCADKESYKDVFEEILFEALKVI